MHLEHLAGEVYDRRFRELLVGLLADDSLRREWRLLRRESRRALRPVLRPPRDQRLARR